VRYQGPVDTRPDPTDRQGKEVLAMSRIHRLTTLGTAALVALSLLAAPASAKKPRPAGEFDRLAVIDCGDGPTDVGTGDDLWAPLVALNTGEKYKPIAFKVSGEGFSVDVSNGKANKHSVVCSYDDGEAKGTVTLKKGPKGD
jgi:hypothetical protein